MNITRLTTSIALTAAFAVPACSGDDGDTGGASDTETSSGSDTESSSTGSTNPTATSGPGTSSGTDSGTTNTTTGATDSGGSDTGTDSAGTNSGGSSGAGACTSWVVTYDLTGSKYVIDALADFEITVQEPYTDDLNTGPGTIKIRFTDDGGAPGSGTAQIIDYSLDLNFVTGSFGTNVTTDLDTTSGPDACGTAAGTFDGTTLTWDSPKEMNPYCRDGMVSCSGGFCGGQGAPPEGQPFVFNNDCTEPFPLNDFTFTNGTDNFTMPEVTVSQDANQATKMTFVGTATATEEDASTPMCACG